jgi:isopenicillin-N epimerase
MSEPARDRDWQATRADFFLEPGVTYLNTGSYGLTPRPVFEVVTELRRQLASEPVDFLWRQFPEELAAARRRLAGFLGAPADQLVFMANVTAAINTLAAGLKLAPRRDILVADQEYGAMVYAWERAAARCGAAVRTFDLPAGQFSKAELLDRFAAALAAGTEPPQLLFLSHVSYVTGLVLPVRDICELARARGVRTVVDGAHAPGMIALDLARLGCDFYAGNCHKWLLAPIGSGFLYAAPGAEEQFEPLVVSWGWKRDRKLTIWDPENWTPWLRSHEFQGTRDPAPWLATPAAIDYHERLGSQAIQARDRDLARYARRRLVSIPGIEPAIPDDAELSAALVAYRVPGIDYGELHRQLWQEHRIEVPTLERPTGTVLRVSTHFYNTEAEIDRLHDALRGIVGR